MDSIHLSIIIPVYNMEKYLARCLDSVIGQTYRDMEIILVDDGSVDLSGTMCDEYACLDDRVRVLHQTNAGVAAARNAGLAAAGGEWIYLMDADDWLEPEAVSRVMRRLEDSDLDCMFTDCIEQYDNGSNRRLRLFLQEFETDDPDVLGSILRSILCHKMSPYYSRGADDAYPAPWSKWVRASVIKENRIIFTSKVKGIYDDGLFTLQVLKKSAKVAYMDFAAYNYRIISASITRSYRQDLMECFTEGCGLIDDLAHEWGEDGLFRQAEYCRRIAYLTCYMTSYFFNPASDLSRDEQNERVKETLNQDIYSKAIKKAKFKWLEGKHRYSLVCMKMGFVGGLRLYARAKRRFKG